MSEPPNYDVPDWWRENAELRRTMGLPNYEPPRFADGVYTYDVISRLEAAYDATIRFVGVDTRYEDDWEIRVDGEPVREIGRHRDRNGNTVFEASSDEVRAELEATLLSKDERE
ncbi:hypothetical protein ACFQPA_17370 [Halomarina halobia]|uniref:Uncharacterized protein n=1 Tax=Halomarina halobia TaxID=3033386 RepID=A0ABD6AEE6_9EURY|nr:hypothetical protein [Halomarina sp. PSR21]